MLFGTLGLTVLMVIAILWPACIAWPFAVLAAWFALNLGVRSWRIRARYRPQSD
jgi:cardiolipin synthase